MQPVPEPGSWFITWLGEQKVLNREILVAYQRKLDEERKDRPLLDPNPPTLGGLLERDGHLTKEQRETGEREAERRRCEFMKWRAQAIQQHLPRVPGQ